MSNPLRRNPQQPKISRFNPQRVSLRCCHWGRIACISLWNPCNFTNEKSLHINTSGMNCNEINPRTRGSGRPKNPAIVHNCKITSQMGIFWRVIFAKCARVGIVTKVRYFCACGEVKHFCHFNSLQLCVTNCAHVMERWRTI